MNLTPTAKQKFFNNNGEPLVGGLLFTYTAGTTTKVATYKNQAGTTNTNPIVLDYRGECDLWLDPSLTYKFVLAPPGDTDPPTKAIWTVDNITALGNQQDIGQILFPRTPAEIIAGVTPVFYGLPEGWGKRYGVVADGATDDRLAIMQAYAVFKAGGAAPILRGTSYVSQDAATGYALLFDSHVILNGDGQFILKGHTTDNYTLIKAIGGTDIAIDVRGVAFDNNKAAPNRTVDNNDIGLRIESDVYTVNVEDCKFRNANEDGIYFRANVTGPGGSIHRNKFYNIARSGVTAVKGQRVSIDHNEARDIQLQAFVVQAVDITTLCRGFSVDYNRIIGGGTDLNNGSDRAAIYIGHLAGAAAAVMGGYTCRGNVIKDYGATYTGGLRALGVEIRECDDILVSGNEVTGVISAPGKTGVTGENAGLYAYLARRVTFVANLSNANDKGWWVNSCTDVTESDNTCIGNLIYNRDYHGPDGASTFLVADGLNACLARGNVSNAGTPSLNESFNVTSLTDLGVGDTRINFSRNTGAAGNYTINQGFRSFSGTAGTITAASPSTSTCRILTFKAGAAADENFTFEIVGPMEGTNLPP